MITEFLKESSAPLVLDGPLGTELQRRGYKTTLPLWSALANSEAPDLVCDIHKDYLLAGANILTTNTFRTTAHTLGKKGKSAQARPLTAAAVELAHQAIKESGLKAYVAASIAPLEDCYQPALLPPRPKMVEALDMQLDILADCRIDCILAETMINMPEAEYIAERLTRVDVPFMMSFTTDGGTRLLDGTPLEHAVRSIAVHRPLALMVNCRPVEAMDAALDILLDEFTGPVGVYANGPGRPDPVSGWEHEDQASQKYADFARRWLQRGARIIGGCCGTTPQTISSISALIRSLKDVK